MRHRRIGSALAASLLLHGAIALLLIFRAKSCAPPPAAPVATSNEVVPLEWVDATPRPQPAPEPTVPPTPTPPQKSKPKPTKPAPVETPSPAPPATAQRPSDAPTQPAPEASRPKINLAPSTLPEGVAVPEGTGEPSHGHTLHPGDSALSAEEKKAEEEHRVNGRVQEFAWDGLAESRAQPGIAHPYFGQIGDALRAGLSHAKGVTPAQLGAPSPIAFMTDQYFQTAANYARTGDPGITPGQAPRQSEILREQFGSEGQGVQALAQAGETKDDLLHDKPLLSLTFELHQAADGAYRSGKILEKSKSPRFDAFVLRVVPAALANLAPPPQEVLHGRDDLRSVWSIEGWPKYTLAETLAPQVGVEGIPTDLIKHQLESDKREFDFRARLLKAYY